MPRRSIESLSIVAPAAPPLQATPPSSLSAAQLRLWRTLTESLPAGWFGPAQTPLLLQLVRHCVRLDDVEQRIGNTDPADIDAYNKLCRLSIAESQHVNALCRSLRLTLSSIKQHVASSRMKQPLGRRDFSVLYSDE